MLSSDKNIRTISQLIAEIKRYVELRAECMQIDLVSKMATLLAATLLCGIVAALGMIAILLLSFWAVSLLKDYVGGPTCAYALVAALYLLAAFVVYLKRKTWIEAPVANFLGRLFLGDTDDSSPKQ